MPDHLLDSVGYLESGRGDFGSRTARRASTARPLSSRTTSRAGTIAVDQVQQDRVGLGQEPPVFGLQHWDTAVGIDPFYDP